MSDSGNFFSYFVGGALFAVGGAVFTLGGAVFTVEGATQNCYGPHGPKIWEITQVWQNKCTDDEGWVGWWKKSTKIDLIK